MDQDVRALIVQLCSYAGAMMEDASVSAVTATGVPEIELLSVLDGLTRQARNISALLAGATALADPFDDSH
ncbi:MAG: hypothetical protein JWO15_270 [Sphingomonadales bacterium]|nr:hypothetical protein [Sphingomonadales bacterium]